MIWTVGSWFGGWETSEYGVHRLLYNRGIHQWRMQLDTSISQRSSVEDETMLFIHIGSRMGNNWKRRAYIKFCPWIWIQMSCKWRQSQGKSFKYAMLLIPVPLVQMWKSHQDLGFSVDRKRIL
jgi:hypothetical protein